MVKYKKKYEDKDVVIYSYVVESYDDSPGEIKIDKNSQTIEMVPSEHDIYHLIDAEELNDSIDAINKMKKENGNTDFLERVSDDYVEEFYTYADHAIRGIEREIENGKYPEEGMSAWY